jgi:hypothetical protein
MKVNYDTVPVDYMADAVQRYVEKGIMPGGFLTALFSNDLKGAVQKADGFNREHLVDWVRWCYNEMPATAWGSVAAVRDWTNSFVED